MPYILIDEMNHAMHMETWTDETLILLLLNPYFTFFYWLETSVYCQVSEFIKVQFKLFIYQNIIFKLAYKNFFKLLQDLTIRATF